MICIYEWCIIDLVGSEGWLPSSESNRSGWPLESRESTPDSCIITQKERNVKRGKMSAPRKGTEVRKNVMIRLEPSEKELLIKHFGGVQAAIDSVINKLKSVKSK